MGRTRIFLNRIQEREAWNEAESGWMEDNDPVQNLYIEPQGKLKKI